MSQTEFITSFYANKKNYRQLQDICNGYNVSVSSVINQLITDYVELHGFNNSNKSNIQFSDTAACSPGSALDTPRNSLPAAETKSRKAKKREKSETNVLNLFSENEV